MISGEYVARRNGLLCTLPPNPPFNRSAQRRRRWVPVALRAPAPG
jgi:hypothetical protein